MSSGLEKFILLCNGQGIPDYLDKEVMEEALWACINEHDFFKQMSSIRYRIKAVEKESGPTEFTENLKKLIHDTEETIIQIERDIRNLKTEELLEKYKHNLPAVLAKP